MMNRFHSASLSIFCSLMLASAFLATKAGIALAGAGAAAAQNVYDTLKDTAQTLPKDGWQGLTEVQLAQALTATPVPLTQGGNAGAAKTGDPLIGARDYVLKEGVEGDLSGVLSTLLGLTENNDKLRVKQKTDKVDSETKLANVSVKNNNDIIIGSLDGAAATIYRTTPSGTLVSAAYGKKGEPAKILSNADAAAGFEKEKSFWIKKASGGSTVAATP